MAENKKTGQEIINKLDDLFKKAPKLPPSVQDVLVKIAPILSLVFGVLGIIAGAIGLSSVGLLDGIDSSFGILVSSAALIVSSVLMLMAYPHLKVRKYRGWELLFWSEVVGAVSAVVSISIGSVLGILIGFYLLFQIKSHYK